MYKIASAALVALVIISTPVAQAATCEPSAARKAQIAEWLALFADYEAKYNTLWKTIARAGSAPLNYISPNVSPGIAQGPTIRDSLDGQEILRKDLYFAHDETAKARQACRDLNCDSYTLPSTHTGAQAALNAFKAAAKALPLFYGPSGMMLTGPGYSYTGRFMGNNDADALRKELVPKACDDDTDRQTTPPATTTPPTTPTGTYTLEYVTGLLKQIQTLTVENASLKSQLLQCKSAQPQCTQTQAAATAGNAASSVSPSSAACPALSRSLEQGANGFDVTQLQQFLAKDASIYPEGLVTGYFGPATLRAVQRWQSQKGVASYGDQGFGTVGPRTQAAIRSACY